MDEKKRLKVLEEAKRVTKSGGSIFLVENGTHSEFEYYRGRHLNTKAQDYNDWITSHGFKIFKQLETLITFENQQVAANVFKEIWKDKLFDTPKSNIIKNNVIIFELKID